MAIYKNYSSQAEKNLANLNKKTISDAKNKVTVLPDPLSVYPTKTPTETLLNPKTVTYEGAVSQGIFPTMTKVTPKPTIPATKATTPTSTTTPTITQNITTQTYTQGVGKDEDVYTRDMSGLDAQGNQIYGSFDEITNIQDQYERNNALKNYYRSKGIPFQESDFPTSAEDELRQNLYNQEQEKSVLEKDIARQKEEALKNLQQTKEASNLAFAQSREGVTSYARTMAPSVIGEAATKAYYDQTRRIDESKRKLDNLVKAQQREWVAGRDDQIQRAKMELVKEQQALQEQTQKGKDDMLKILSLDSEKLVNLSDESIAMLTADAPQFAGLLQSARDSAQEKYFQDKAKNSWETRKSQLETFNTFAKEGVIMSPQMLAQMSQETRIPISTLMDFNNRAQQIMSDKNIDTATKQVELEKAMYELDNISRGITFEDAKKVDFLTRMRQEGKSEEEIREIKRIFKIQDMDDPMYVAELQQKQLQNQASFIGNKYLDENKRLENESLSQTNIGKYYDNIIKEAQANNAPLSEIIKLQKLQQEARELKIKTDQLLGIDSNIDIGTIGTFLNSAKTQGYDTNILYTIPGQRKGKHDGIDFVLPGGTDAKVNSPVGGTIMEIIRDKGTGKGWGNSIVFVDNYGKEHRISHLNNIADSLAVGTVIDAGTYLGNQGNTGYSTGNHVDYRVKENGEYIDPIQYMNELQTKTSNKGIFAKDPIKKEEFKTEMRKEFDGIKQKTNYTNMKNATDAFNEQYALYEKNKAEGKDTSGQVMSIITLFNKGLDPGSVVREGEYNRVGEISSKADQVELWFKKIEQSGQVTTPEVLKSLKDSIDSLKSSYDKNMVEKSKQLFSQAEQVGLSDQDLMSIFEQSEIDQWKNFKNTKEDDSLYDSLSDDEGSANSIFNLLQYFK